MGVGRRLRQAREARALSMAEVAASTKIPIRQLAALEAENYDQLPGGIFVRGHIRAAAKAVGLDPMDLTEHYQEETSPPRAVSDPASTEPVEDVGPRLRMAAEPVEPRPKRRLVAALVILVSIMLALAWFGRERDLPPASRNGASPGTPMAAAMPAASRSILADEPGAVGTVGTTSRGTRADGVPLALKAQRVCWLSLTVDGHRVAYRMLQEGEIVTARMHEGAAIRTGDAGALLLSIGRGPEKSLGAPGAVRNIEFTPADYMRLLGR